MRNFRKKTMQNSKVTFILSKSQNSKLPFRFSPMFSEPFHLFSTYFIIRRPSVRNVHSYIRPLTGHFMTTITSSKGGKILKILRKFEFFICTRLACWSWLISGLGKQFFATQNKNLFSHSFFRRYEEASL